MRVALALAKDEACETMNGMLNKELLDGLETMVSLY